MKRGEGLLASQALLALLGFWLVVSPWVFGYARHTHAVDDALVGALLIATAIVSALLGPVTAIPLWTAVGLGVWMVVTPMMFGQFGQSFSANSDLIVGLLTVLAAGTGLVSRARMRILATTFGPHAAEEQTSLS